MKNIDNAQREQLIQNFYTRIVYLQQSYKNMLSYFYLRPVPIPDKATYHKI